MRENKFASNDILFVSPNRKVYSKFIPGLSDKNNKGKTHAQKREDAVYKLLVRKLILLLDVKGLDLVCKFGCAQSTLR